MSQTTLSCCTTGLHFRYWWCRARRRRLGAVPSVVLARCVAKANCHGNACFKGQHADSFHFSHRFWILHAPGDVITVILDFGAQTVSFAKNGVCPGCASAFLLFSYSSHAPPIHFVYALPAHSQSRLQEPAWPGPCRRLADADECASADSLAAGGRAGNGRCQRV